MRSESRASGRVPEVGWIRLAEQGRLVLASASPRRARLLELVGVPFTSHPSDVVEEVPGGAPAERALLLAEAKARSVARYHPESLVLGGDTEVVLDGRILGKPSSPEDALKMLMQLRGRSHKVVTALYLLDVPSGATSSGVEETRVTMRAFSDAEAELYAHSGEPMDKAGAYAIQGKAAVLVESIEGCYYNVVGLPLTRLAMMMDDLWYALRSGRG
jgi:septum formation protein